MNKRALLFLSVALLLPSLALAAPVKRMKMNGRAKEVTLNLKGVKTTNVWTTPASITQTGSTVTINFRQVDGMTSTWSMKKTKKGWLRNVPAFEVPVPADSDFYYCEMSGSFFLTLSGSNGSFGSYWQMDCDNDDGTVTAVSALALKLRR